MAEFNLFLGTARKSVGDITLYRREGRQVARVRVRDIANPKSEGQSETRNFLAPVIKFYAPLRRVLARSFEGLSKSKSYNEFQRTNIRLARQQQWFLQKGIGFYPFPYMVSRGTLTPVNYWYDSTGGDGTYCWDIPNLVLIKNTIGALSSSLVSNGAKAGDVYTLIYIMQSAAGDYYPSSAQFVVNPNNLAALSTIFAGVVYMQQNEGSIGFYGATDKLVGFAVIAARPSKDGWLRSTQYLLVDPTIVSESQSATRRAEAIASYGPQKSDSEGDVYLDGDGQSYDCQTISGRALLFIGGQYNAQAVLVATNYGIMLKPANLEEYFYVRSSSHYLLGTNSNRSLAPSDWRYINTDTSAATDANTISAAPGTPFYDYLITIGFTSN